MKDGYSLTSLYKASSEKGREIGVGFEPLVFHFQQFLDLPKEKKEKVFLQCVEIMRKLGKVANAVDRYHELEKKEKQELIEMVKKDKSSVSLTHASNSIELEGQIEEVLTQAKSLLDIMVKILDPIFGINLHTFGKGGEKIISALERQVPKDLQSMVEPLKKLVEDSKPWIKIIKDARDKQHYENIKVAPMRVTLDKGKIHFVAPIIGGQSVEEYVNIVYDNLFFFVQDFVVAAQSARFVGGLVPIVAEGVGKNRVFAVGIRAGAIKKGSE